MSENDGKPGWEHKHDVSPNEWKERVVQHMRDNPASRNPCPLETMERLWNGNPTEKDMKMAVIALYSTGLGILGDSLGHDYPDFDEYTPVKGVH